MWLFISSVLFRIPGISVNEPIDELMDIEQPEVSDVERSLSRNEILRFEHRLDFKEFCKLNRK